jgi:hypothetical protein
VRQRGPVFAPSLTSNLQRGCGAVASRHQPEPSRDSEPASGETRSGLGRSRSSPSRRGRGRGGRGLQCPAPWRSRRLGKRRRKEEDERPGRPRAPPRPGRNPGGLGGGESRGGGGPGRRAAGRRLRAGPAVSQQGTLRPLIPGGRRTAGGAPAPSLPRSRTRGGSRPGGGGGGLGDRRGWGGGRGLAPPNWGEERVEGPGTPSPSCVPGVGSRATSPLSVPAHGPPFVLFCFVSSR